MSHIQYPLISVIHILRKLKKNTQAAFISIKDVPHFIAFFAPTAFATAVSEFIDDQALTNKTLIDKKQC